VAHTALLRRHGRLDDAVDDEPEPHQLLAFRTPKGGERWAPPCAMIHVIRC
jgi:hypothetical protein